MFVPAPFFARLDVEFFVFHPKKGAIRLLSTDKRALGDVSAGKCLVNVSEITQTSSNFVVRRVSGAKPKRRKEERSNMHQNKRTPNRLTKWLASSALALSLLGSSVAFAQGFDPNKVIAKVGEETISEAELGYALEDMGDEINQIPPAERRQFLVEMLVDMKVMAQAARKSGMADTDTFAHRQAYLEDRSLRRAYLQDVMAAEISDEEMKQEYDAVFAGFEPKELLRARHILLSSEDDAKAVVAELEKGADFIELAKTKSTGPSGPQGGDLGYFGEGDMVPEFYAGAKALEVGGFSQPVQSQFGWHVIKLEDRKPSEPPAMEQVAPQIRQRIMVRKFEQLVADLKAGTTIEIMPEDAQ